jgi:hypothetical protein
VRQPLASALTSIVAGSASGGAVICLALFAATTRDAAPMPALVPAVAGVGGIAAGGLVAWSLGRPLGSLYYRAVLAMMGVFGTALIGALTVPAHLVAGRWGLAALGVACVAAIAGSRRLLLGRAT